ncbi:hypothetical protein [Streptomyces qinzhouensis]|uniref:Uncharacterized protein n=1 Tax=Streptomyces qinzhouensis TaxID=2599401 RepID=A0A5B8IL93_9ACTN|nr:hypothetical protein [Streptomyces qinzhouensis]QDY79312.1 hypothetical protein FQU76_25425 [Streptomyces qinzhouensis]
MTAPDEGATLVCGEELVVFEEIRELVIPCFPSEDPARIKARIRCPLSSRHAGRHTGLVWELVKSKPGNVWLTWCRIGSAYEWGMHARSSCPKRHDGGTDCGLYEGHDLGRSYEPTDEQTAFIAAAGAAHFLRRNNAENC